jgi:hypothetical protein
LKPLFHFIGSRVGTGCCQAVGYNRTQLVQPNNP